MLSISRRYRSEGLTSEDLFQEGVLGLMRAIDKFDPDRATVDELVEATALPPSTVRQLLQLAPGTGSLDELVGDGLRTLVDLQVDGGQPGIEEIVVERSAADEVEALLRSLPDRERELLRLRFGIIGGKPRTLEEVGRHFGLTRERIRQLEARALSRLRNQVGRGRSETGEATSA